MYACVYVCMHVCMYVCTCVHTRVCMHVCLYACVYVCTYVRVCTYVHSSVCQAGTFPCLFCDTARSVNQSVRRLWMVCQRLSVRRPKKGTLSRQTPFVAPKLPFHCHHPSMTALSPSIDDYSAARVIFWRMPVRKGMGGWVGRSTERNTDTPGLI